MIAVKLFTPYMPRFETVNVRPPSSGGVIVPATDALGEQLASRGDLPEGLLVGVEHRRHDEGVLSRDRDADVDPRVKLQAPVAVAAVGGGVLPQ